MDVQNLVKMANRIGDFFDSLQNTQEAKEGIVNHIQKFWEPRMRESLIAKLATPETAELHPNVRAAITENLARLARKTAKSNP